jgi:hypothetical protein
MGNTALLRNAADAGYNLLGKNQKVGNILPLHPDSSTLNAFAFRSFIKDMHKIAAALLINIAS